MLNLCKGSIPGETRVRRASSIAMDPKMQKKKSIMKQTGLDELKKEVEMDEHQIPMADLIKRLCTDKDVVSAVCGPV